MKEAIVHPNGTVTINTTPIPTLGPHDILVKVAVAGTNPKDWKFPEVLARAHNSGDDLAGIVEAVGSSVCEFRVGDRVAGMHRFPEPHGAFAEYAVLRGYMTFHIPLQTSFEEAATIPLAALTAAFGLFYVLGLPAPWHRAPKAKIPLVIYGASSAVGAFAIKLASAANIHPIVAIGSPNSVFIEEFLDSNKGDVLVDYTIYTSPELLLNAVQNAIKKAGIADGRPFHAFDTVSQPETFHAVLGNAMTGPPKGGLKPKVAVVLPDTDNSIVDSSVDIELAYCGLAHEGDDHDMNFAAAFFRMMTLGLKDGWFKGHPYEVRPGGLDGVESVLREFKEGMVRAKKLLLRIG